MGMTASSSVPHPGRGCVPERGAEVLGALASPWRGETATSGGVDSPASAGHMPMTASILAGAIVSQFPDQFTG